MDDGGEQELLILENDVATATTTVRRGAWRRSVMVPLVVVLLAAFSLAIWATGEARERAHRTPRVRPTRHRLRPPSLKPP